MERQRLTRKELYELVWTVPMVKLAPRFGMSDVALRKRCHKLDIPTPGAGYWPQVAMGQRPPRVELPPGDGDHGMDFDVHEEGASVPRPAAPTVELAERAEDLHPAAAWLDASLRKAKLDEHGRKVVGGEWNPVAILSEGCRERALLLIDALFKTLEARGHKVEARNRGENSNEKSLLVTAFNQVVSIEVEEKLSRKPHVLTADELREKERWEKSGWGRWDRTPKYDYYPMRSSSSAWD